MSKNRTQPGANDVERSRFHVAQQALRKLAERGFTLEVDEDGAPMPCATGTCDRLPSDPDTLPSSMPALKVKSSVVLGDYTRIWRRRLNLTTAEMAERAHVSKRFFSDLETGKPGVQLGKTLAALDVLGLELVVRPKRPARKLW